MLIAAAAGFVGLRGGDAKQASARACPPGFIRAEKDLAERYEHNKRGESERAREAEGADAGGLSSKYCMNVSHPESSEDLSKFGDNLARHAGGDRPGQLRAAIAQKAKLSDDKSVPGADGTWEPLGKGPLVSDDPKYAYNYGDAFGKLSGRISDYAYDSSTLR